MNFKRLQAGWAIRMMLLHAATAAPAGGAAALLAACVTNPVAPPATPQQAPVYVGPQFYPPLPSPPRIMHLATLSGERDLAGNRDAFADFILGEEARGKRLDRPYGVAIHRGKLYVADSGAGALGVFDLGQRRYQLVTGKDAGRMRRPLNVRIDADGTKYVTDSGRDQVLVFDRDDAYVGAFGAPGQFRPVDVAIAGNRLYVSDILHHQIQVLDKRSGKVQFVFGRQGAAAGELSQPTHLALGPDGDLYVVEAGNSRVQRFTAAGKPVKSYGGPGATPAVFARPRGIAVDKAGRLYVGDAAYQSLMAFDAAGRLQMFVGQSGELAEGISLPAGISIDYDNVAAFRHLATPSFAIDYLIFAASQFGPSKVDVYAYGRLDGMAYPDAAPAPRAAR